MHKLRYIDKALSYLDSELSLIHLRIEHPEQFQQFNLETFQSDLYIIPESKGLGIIGMAEIVIALYLLAEIMGNDGKPITLIQLAKGFEKLFNFSFGNIYKKMEAIFNRKHYNLTKTLDILHSAIIREDRKRNANKQDEKR